MKPSVTIIIPAWNEETLLPATLSALYKPEVRRLWDELLVIDDGSSDRTFFQAQRYADEVIRHGRNLGKGASLDNGWRQAKGEILVFLDADLGETAERVGDLLHPVTHDGYDMSIARLPAARRKGGFGLVRGLAGQGIYLLSGYRTHAPLSGQRALRREVLERIGGLSRGFGIEVGLTIDAARSGFAICEIAVAFRHRETGRDWSGFLHRGKQFVSVGRTLLHKWRHPVC